MPCINLQKNTCAIKACAGSGKTEVVGIRSAFYIKQWSRSISGVGVLTFTNNATNVIRDRISEFIGSRGIQFPHYIGTFDSWLHRYIANPFAHLMTGYGGKDGDHSLRIIDDHSQAGFLNSFTTKYKYWGTGNIKANEFFIDPENKGFVFVSATESLNVIRNQASLETWQKKDLFDTKRRFWKSGFVTYQDVEFLCCELFTKNSQAAEMISNRFPLLLIDECQDLGPLQLQILQKLLDSGTVLHFVGDLNQGIYLFRHVDPEKIGQFTQKNHFAVQNLTHNFRSIQSIVNLCSKLVIQDPVTGRKNPEKVPTCLCVTYERKNIQEIPGRFINYLKLREIDTTKSIILTRNNNTVAKLRPGASTNLKDSMLLALAIQLWKTPNMSNEQITDALICSGKYISMQYFSSPSSNRQYYYCPESVKSKVEWRLFLANVLDECSKHQNLSNLEQTWKDWAESYRKTFFHILKQLANERDQKQFLIQQDPPKYAAPKGFSEKLVFQTLETIQASANLIRITNFHQVKGETVEAAMVVSSPTAQGGGEGFWKNWLLDPRSENARFAYVASSRPRELLVWAVPAPLGQDDVVKLQSLGFELTKDL